MITKNVVKTAAELLDRFFRDAEGKTNRQIDVYFAIEDLGIPRDRADQALDYLSSRGLINAFGPDVAFLTDKGVAAMVEEQDIARLPKEVRDFERKKPVLVPTEDISVSAPDEATEPPRAVAGTPDIPRPLRPRIVVLLQDGGQEIIDLAWSCTLGRSENNTFQLPDQRASKQHVELRFERGGYIVKDLESANGTVVNGEYIDTHALRHGDRMLVGRTTIVYECPELVPVPNGAPPEGFQPTDEVQPAFAVEAPAEPGLRIVTGQPEKQPRRHEATPSSDLFATTPQESPKDLFAAPREPSEPKERRLFETPTPPEAEALFTRTTEAEEAAPLPPEPVPIVDAWDEKTPHEPPRFVRSQPDAEPRARAFDDEQTDANSFAGAAEPEGNITETRSTFGDEEPSDAANAEDPNALADTLDVRGNARIDGEALPIASATFADAESPQRVESTQLAEFRRMLRAVRAGLDGAANDQRRLCDAIDLLADHPRVEVILNAVDSDSPPSLSGPRTLRDFG